MSFSYSYAGTDVTQSQLASSYTNALSSYLKTDGADFVAFLSNAVNGLSVDAALALKAAVEAGNFTLSGLFGAAQSKTGAVDGDLIDNPVPTLTVGDVSIDLSAMLGNLGTATWNTVTTAKKIVTTTYHTREFYTTGGEPADYDANWATPAVTENQAPTADAIVLKLTEYDEHAEANANPVNEGVNLLTAANAADADGDSLSVVAGSVKLVGGGDLPTYISYTDGILTIDQNHSSLDDLYLGVERKVAITYEITDGQGHTITNTVDLTITGTADQFNDSTTITVTKIGDLAYTETGAYALLGFDWSNVNVNVTGYGDYDYKTEGFTVTGDVDATYTGINFAGGGVGTGNGVANYENSFISVNPTETLDSGWSNDGDLDYTVSFLGPVDGYTSTDTDASVVNISLSYDYWM